MCRFNKKKDTWPPAPGMQIPGVPIMYIHSHRYSIERLPEATMGGAPRT